MLLICCSYITHVMAYLNYNLSRPCSCLFSVKGYKEVITEYIRQQKNEYQYSCVMNRSNTDINEIYCI